MNEEADYYINEEGLFTFTARHHLKRGHCCGNGCRHCPFDFVEVPEPRRSLLLQKRKEREEQQGNKK